MIRNINFQTKQVLKYRMSYFRWQNIGFAFGNVLSSNLIADNPDKLYKAPSSVIPGYAGMAFLPHMTPFFPIST